MFCLMTHPLYYRNRLRVIINVSTALRWTLASFWFLNPIHGARGSVVVKALCHKREGCLFETLRVEFFFFSLPNHSGRSSPWGSLSL
jgi:hypothetical protein